jgi:hypothetical protein
LKAVKSEVLGLHSRDATGEIGIVSSGVVVLVKFPKRLTSIVLALGPKLVGNSGSINSSRLKGDGVNISLLFTYVYMYIKFCCDW